VKWNYPESFASAAADGNGSNPLSNKRRDVAPISAVSGWRADNGPTVHWAVNRGIAQLFCSMDGLPTTRPQHGKCMGVVFLA
jgi:hypothetical protein